MTVQGGVFYGWKNLRKPPRAARRKTTAAVLLAAFGCGVGSCMLLLAACAFLLTHTALPLGLVRPMACMAAAAGAAVSAAVLAHQCGEKLLLCGLGCGVFYTACLLGASLLAGGEVTWQGSNVMLPIALLLGGLLGSAVTALRTNR